ncbi:hypothetical protein SAMN05216262_102104 [Colwellia chukchiensis]|uniref:DUF3300 domain-containing protein n=1 Tax=Colwellia chukchiensis TaxID=641665 RepID=A0A1H7J178_9GAMM|nr:hypothetical protein [Colwellia chukchiensis]SEK68184.1 hypothetical protein SAMN05216262_102104 [Colwellia chukchiensis]
MAEVQPLKSIILLFTLMLFACTDPVKEQITQQIPLTEQRIDLLAQALANGQVRNANLIKQYAARLKQEKPSYKPLIDEFLKDATSQGPMFLALVDRLNTVKNQPQMFANSQAVYEELLNLYQAADPVLFSDALSDPLNVLADMSEGKLPRVNAMSKAQSLAANKAQDFGVGEQLIGNPAYGSWTTGANGMSFWAWYGMYAMMGDLFGSRRTSYSDWGRGRNYSYYNDYGRKRYSSPSQLRQQTDLDTRTRKSFQRRGEKFTSAYSKNRTGASSISSQSKSAQSSANRFARQASNKSAYAKANKNAKNASFRNSRSTTSRSFRRGK